MSMNYSQFVVRLSTNMAGITIVDPNSATPSSDTDFNNFLPEIIDYAEQRIYRELDFLATRTRDVTQKTTPGSRDVPIPSQLVVVEAVALITPANAQIGSSGSSRVPLVRATTDVLDAIWPGVTDVQAPVFGVGLYSIFNQQETGSLLRIAPTPDDAYYVEYRGTFRPAPMSSTNTTTFLGTNLPDLYFAAAMVHASDYMRNFGSGDTPGMATEWESQYGMLKASAAVEELRKKAGKMPAPPQPAPQGA